MAVDNDKIKALILEFEKKCLLWTEQAPMKDDSKEKKYVAIFSKQLLRFSDFSSIKYILVGDNPGKEENDEYFVGTAGKKARSFFKDFLVNDFDSEVLVLNKYVIQSNTTNTLPDKDTSQNYMACLIYKLQALLDVPVVICGYTGGMLFVKKDHTYKQYIKGSVDKAAKTNVFFHALKNEYKDNDWGKIMIVPHFSRDCFFKDIKLENYTIDNALKNMKKISITKYLILGAPK